MFQRIYQRYVADRVIKPENISYDIPNVIFKISTEHCLYYCYIK